MPTLETELILVPQMESFSRLPFVENKFGRANERAGAEDNLRRFCRVPDSVIGILNDETKIK